MRTDHQGEFRADGVFRDIQMLKVQRQPLPQGPGFCFEGRDTLDQPKVVEGVKFCDEFVQQID